VAAATNNKKLNIRIPAPIICLDLKPLTLTAFIVSFLLIAGCSPKTPAIKIGFSYPYAEVGWGVQLKKEIDNEIRTTEAYDIELISLTNDENPAIETRNLWKLYEQGIDVLLLKAGDTQLVASTVAELHQRGLPIILIDRQVATDQYTTFIGRDNRVFGRLAAEYLIDHLDTVQTVVEIAGSSKQSVALLRSEGFEQTLSSYKDTLDHHIIPGDWKPEVTKQQLTLLIESGVQPDFIYCHSDMMALAAREVSDQFSIDPIIVGVDGLLSEGIPMILREEIDATFYNNPGGNRAIEVAIELFEGKTSQKRIELETFRIDSSNARYIAEGLTMLDIQAAKVAQLESQVSYLSRIIGNRNWVIILAGILIVSLIAIALVTARLLRINHLQKDTIRDQNRELTSHAEKLQGEIDTKTLELRDAVANLESVNRIKSEFLGNISHELRTPLHAIVGLSQLLTESNLSVAERKEFGELIHKNSHLLVQQIEDILALSRVSSGETPVEDNLISLPEFMNQFEERIKTQFHSNEKLKNGSVDLVFMAAPSASFITDATILFKILNLLCDNAIKFTTRGTITLGAGILESKADTIRFFVEDTGVGIISEDQSRIFDLFSKASHSSQRISGLGVGLPLAKRLLEAIGGELTFESEVAKGSIFFVDIPMNMNE
jgi:signal transduction histidine kinase